MKKIALVACAAQKSVVAALLLEALRHKKMRGPYLELRSQNDPACIVSTTATDADMLASAVVIPGGGVSSGYRAMVRVCALSRRGLLACMCALCVGWCLRTCESTGR